MADITIKRGLSAKAEAFVLRLFTWYIFIDRSGLHDYGAYHVCQGEVMMEMFVLIKGEPSEPYVCGSQKRIERFCLRQRSPCNG